MSQQINLFNPLFLKKKKYFSSLTMLQGLGLVVLACAAFYGYARYQVSALGGRAAESEKRLTAERANLAKFGGELSPQQRSKRLEEEIRRLEVQVKAKQDVVDILKSGALGNTEGYSPYLRAFARQSLNGLWLTDFSITGAGAELSIAGRVLQPDLVPLYIRRLNTEAVMQGRSFALLQIGQPKPEAQRKDAQIPAFLEFRLQSSIPEPAK